MSPESAKMKYCPGCGRDVNVYLMLSRGGLKKSCPGF